MCQILQCYYFQYFGGMTGNPDWTQLDQECYLELWKSCICKLNIKKIQHAILKILQTYLDTLGKSEHIHSKYWNQFRALSRLSALKNQNNLTHYFYLKHWRVIWVSKTHLMQENYVSDLIKVFVHVSNHGNIKHQALNLIKKHCWVGIPDYT